MSQTIKTTSSTAKIFVHNKIGFSPKISVIMPVFNAAEYLVECLDSITGQTLREIEVICVDDGSTDNSLEILQNYARRDSRITIITQANSGPGIARNCAMGAATGEFLAFMDPDDFYPANTTLEHLYNTAKENNVDICGGTMQRLKDGECSVAPEYLFDKYGLVQYSDYQFDYGYTRFIYNRKLLADNNILFPDYLRQQDPVFFVHAMIAAGKFYAINEPTYIYRVSHTQKQIEWTVRKCQDVAKSLRDLLVLSGETGMAKLHKNMADRVVYPYFVNVFRRLVDENGVPDESLVRLLDALNYNMIYAENPNFALPWFYKSNPRLCKISVIIPVYNVEKYLAQCLDSVIGQTYKNLEIICVNDGSTDGSLKILEQYARQDARIRIINQKNAGLNGARNTGLRNVTGAYITFLDSDDWLDLNWIEKAHAVAVSNNAELVKSGYLHHYEDRIEPDDINDTIDKKARQGQHLGVNENNIVVWATLYDAAFIRKNNLYFDVAIWKHEDILYTLQATFLANKILPLAGTYLNYRRTSSILSAFNKSVYDLLPIINSRAMSFLNAADCASEDYARAVKRLWWRSMAAFSKCDSVPEFGPAAQQEYLNKNYEIFKQVRRPGDIFDAETMKKLGVSDPAKKALVVEINDCHGECLPGYVKYLLDLGYVVDVLVNVVLKPERPMYMFDGNVGVKTRYLSDQEILNYCNSKHINEYDVCLFNSNTLYKYRSKSVVEIINTNGIKPTVMCVEHRLENLPKLNNRAKAIVIKSFSQHKGAFEINPHYFGDIETHEKNKITNFVVAGNIQKTRKNYDLLINAVTELVKKNITDFKVTVIGRGEIGDMPQNIQKFFDIKGRVSYPDLYKHVAAADFFLTLLDPKCEDHDRYLKHGTSGSFQLIYGLNIPCLIAKKFAKFHRFSSDNAIVYNKNADLVDAMQMAIGMNSGEYKKKKDALKDTAQMVYEASLAKMRAAISCMYKKGDIKCYVLLPYYLMANMWMNVIEIPWLKFKKHIKKVARSHSRRGLMDRLEKRLDNHARDILNAVDKKAKIIDNELRLQLDYIRKLEQSLTQSIRQNAMDVIDATDANLKDIHSELKLQPGYADCLARRLSDQFTQNAKGILEAIDTSAKNVCERVSRASCAPSLLNAETYWAHVYHDTINNSSWMGDCSVSPGRWAVSYIVLYVLYRILDEVKPASILECGLGQSSKLTIQYADAHNAKLMICENSSQWLSFFQRQFPTADKYTKILDTEMVQVVPQYESRTYKGFKGAIGNKKFNLVLIDGPLGSSHYSRPQILDVVDNLDKSFVILLDDMNRVGERETWDLLKQRLTERGIEFVDTTYSSDKVLGLLCSSDLQYLTTL